MDMRGVGEEFDDVESMVEKLGPKGTAEAHLPVRFHRQNPGPRPRPHLAPPRRFREKANSRTRLRRSRKQGSVQLWGTTKGKHFCRSGGAGPPFFGGQGWAREG